MNRRVNTIVLSILLLVFLSSCAGLNPPPEQVPKFSTIVVSTVLIESKNIFGIPGGSSNAFFIDLLQEIGTAQVLDSLHRQRIAQTVRRVPSGESENHLLTLQAVVSLPISLPPAIFGINASQRKGPLASISINLKKGAHVLTEIQENLDWNEVRWSTGGHRTRRRRVTEDVLLDAVKEVAKKGVFEVQHQLNLKDVDS